MIETKDIAWLAGIIEGEGSISICNGGFNKTYSKYYITPHIQVTMTDKDVIDRVASIWKSKTRGPYKKERNGTQCKDAYNTSIGGMKAASWLMTLYPLFGVRRRAKAKEVLAKWRELGPTRGKYSSRCIRGHKYDGFSRGQRTCSTCARERQLANYLARRAKNNVVK